MTARDAGIQGRMHLAAALDRRVKPVKRGDNRSLP
jgi:hypothetical protein